MDVRRDTESGELHAKFLENSPSGSHTPPLALPLALPLVAQPVTRQWPGTADSARAHNLPKPHRDGPRGYTQTPDKTSTHTRCSVSPTQGPRTDSR